ncbi:hypothetical protein [Ponticaulis sp.]|nr:hypothetical protein [Ponticaulis sp.]
MKKLVFAAIAGLSLSALAPLATASAPSTEQASSGFTDTCCTPQGCTICL